MSKVANVPTVKLPIFLETNIYDIYAERAAKLGRSVEDEITKRLRDCREHTDASAIYVTNEVRSELTQLSGQLIRTADDLRKWAQKQCSLCVGDVTVPLSTRLADRLRSRCFGATWEEHVRKVVTEELERVVGLR